MARPVCKRFWSSGLFRSATTYPGTEEPEPRWRSARPGPHNVIGLFAAIQTARVPGRRFDCHAISRQPLANIVWVIALTSRDSPNLTPRSERRPQRTSPSAAAPPRRSGLIYWRERRPRHSCVLSPTGSSPSVPVPYPFAQDARVPPERHGSAAFADICSLAC
jgi:hypothetical protein